MNRQAIPVHQLSLPPFAVWDRKWFLLTAGEMGLGKFNTMTVSWGSFGWLWGKPLAMVVVRPTRYTYEFMEEQETFSLSAFPGAYRPALNLLGTKSGRDLDKVAASGLTPIALSHIAAPGFAEADLIVQCRKTYYHDFDPAHFLADYIAPLYKNDYHRMYFGEILAAEGTPEMSVAQA